MKQVTVEAPASSANLGPGFDVFALAFDEPRDTVQIVSRDSDRLGVEIRQMRGQPVPLEPRRNGAGTVSLAIARDLGIKAKITIKLWKRVPIGVGMGSSAASAASTAVAMNELFGLKLKKSELTYYAGKGEEVTSGAAHYDNVAAAILGDFVIVGKGERPQPIRLPAPRNMVLCVATPLVKLPARKTEYARSILPKTVSLSRVVENVANASTIVSGFAFKDIGLIGRGMNDSIVEGARKRMVPGYELVKERATGAGASGVCISGAGPSMLAIVDGMNRARRVLDSMLAAFSESDVESRGFVTRVGKGARVVEGK